MTDANAHANVEEHPDYIRLKVVGEKLEIHFRMKKTTALGKLLQKYVEYVNVPIASMYFLHNGHRFDDNATPTSLGLVTGDAIEAREKIFDEVHFDTKCGAPTHKLKAAYAKRVGVPVENLTFHFNLHEINDDETPNALKLEDDNIITAISGNPTT